MLELFITVLSWILCPLSLILFVILSILQYNYDNNTFEKLLDATNGIKKVYIKHNLKLFGVFVVSLCWLITYYYFI